MAESESCLSLQNTKNIVDDTYVTHYTTSLDVPAFDYQGKKLKKYTCSSCGDCFLFKSSLKDHFKRKSVNITCIKSTDSSKINFYNRCALIFYLNQNQNFDKFKSISFSPLMDNKITKWISKKPSHNLESKSSLNDLEKNNKINCPECGIKINSLNLQKLHFSSINLTSKPIQCEICKLWTPNSCSYKAHKRLHSGLSPFICPECGFCNSQSFQKHLNHILIQCSHFFRQLFYTCPDCFHAFKTLSRLIEHIISLHIQCLFECLLCKKKFNDEYKFETHVSQHENLVNTQKNVIIKCSICFMEIPSKNYYFAHLQSHGDNLIRFGFKCYFCPDKVLWSTQESANHFQTVHFNQFSLNDKLKDICARYKLEFSCHFTTENSYPDNLICKVCKFKAKNIDQLMDHGIVNYIKKHLFVCLICSNQPFSQQNDLLRHIKKFHAQLNKCPSSNCVTLHFTKSEEMLKHLLIKHEIAENNFSTNKTKLADKHDKQRLEVLPMSLTYNNEESILSNYLNSPSKPKSSSKIKWFNCSYCSFKCECKLKLRNHYLSHRTNKAPYFCLKCGSSFVTFLSLECHLLSGHSIADSKAYLKKHFPDLYKHHFDQEDINLLDIIYSPKSTVSTCPICFKSCLNSIDLKSHVKVHGMAFIKSYQKVSSAATDK